VKGSTIDYVQEMMRSAFAVMHNPQSESACGCGSSFAVKNFASNPAID
jgi:Fe-S cluster assembly iron-binding protein IscA